ncbi:methylated-DNA--[protein]-cysteine S-methyltransferase [Microbaculum marinum]|uniref:methylated-DNA--[protein]-cysteine S-methyltransferase n=1 Tax=Microbaculum marinum TaxID=1764581 RepID=A0AAW9RVG8_9HYPH
MESIGFTLFDAAVGRCGIAWGDQGIVAVQLPERSDTETRTRLLRKAPGAVDAEPDANVRGVIADIVALLEGELRDFSMVRYDERGVSEFNRRVYEVALTIPPGETLTYGDIANRLGEPGAARAVGKALGENPWPIMVPCHRVLAAGGRTGGFSAPGGIDTKLKMLSIERRHRSGPRMLFDDDPNFDYRARA